MKRETLDLLCCPECKGEIRLHEENGAESLESGFLICTACDRRYSIEDGIPRFIRPEELDSLNRRFTRLYNWFSRFYPFLIKLGFLGFGGERKARGEVLGKLKLRGGRTLEVSIGTGDNLPYLFESPEVGEIYGLDISSGQIARCSRLVDKRGWPVDLFLGTAEALPFKADSFDNILHIGGINFFSGKKQAIDEMIRVAQPGAKIVIADEGEEEAKNIARFPCLSGVRKGEALDLTVPVHLVPDTMQNIMVEGIWKAHGHHHGYCLHFSKPR